MKDWEKYEEQIFSKLKEEFPDSDILKDQKIKGKYSKRSRQIDILVKTSAVGKEIIVVVDCKKFNKKINLNTAESFLGFTEDVGAHVGIMITNEGYTKSAYNRVENYQRDIHLNIVEFKKLDDYHFTWDSCDLCRDDDGFPRGEISWNEPEILVKDGIITLIEIGDCSYCGEKYIKCQGCGEIMNFGISDEVECLCENVFSIQSEYIGEGMTEETIYVKSQKKEAPKFVDPNQVKLFE